MRTMMSAAIGPVLPFAGIGLAALQLPQSGRW
jgi:hypothetical protein